MRKRYKLIVKSEVLNLQTGDNLIVDELFDTAFMIICQAKLKLNLSQSMTCKIPNEQSINFNKKQLSQLKDDTIK